jgi:hypothetical protein
MGVGTSIERLNTETGRSITSRIHWVSYSKPSGHAPGNCRSDQTLKKSKYLSVCDREERGCGEVVVCICERVSLGTGRVQAGESYLDCHIHVDTLISRTIQTEAGGCGCDNQWTCVDV